MWGDVKAIYRDSWRAALALPLLFLIPGLVEFAQHVAEARAGFYDSMAAAKASAADPSRMVWGYAKTLALLLPSWWLVRWLAFRDAQRAWRPEMPAFGLWLVVFAYGAATLAWGLFGPPVGQSLGLTGDAAKAAAILSAIASFVLGILLNAWKVAWPLGNVRIGPLRSVPIMMRFFWQTIVYTVAGMLPLIALHYALGYGAMGLPATARWAILAVDAIIVAALALTLTAANYYAALRACERAGEPLAPPQ